MRKQFCPQCGSIGVRRVNYAKRWLGWTCKRCRHWWTDEEYELLEYPWAVRLHRMLVRICSRLFGVKRP
ncbi:MAG: hypothetical protein GX410_01755 [Elusimicrobia bacterium]|nr:hypothetical protein [Elusimicrobiota bacterium]